MAIGFADLLFHATFKNKLYSNETGTHFEIEKPLLNLQNENKNIHPGYITPDLNFTGQMQVVQLRFSASESQKKYHLDKAVKKSAIQNQG